MREARLDLVVIAGDSYDRAVPSPDAVRLLGDTLTELTLGTGVPVLAISGNHDSAGRVRDGAGKTYRVNRRPTQEIGKKRSEGTRTVQARGCIIDLQQTGRMVGLISHAEEMSSWTPARIKVNKSPLGSVIVA